MTIHLTKAYVSLMLSKQLSCLIFSRLLYAHSQASKMLIENATTFNLSPKDLLIIAVTAERNDLIEIIVTTFPEIKTQLKDGFIVACCIESLPIMERLMALTPVEVLAMIKARDYDAFRYAAEYHHTHITNRLLLFPTVLAYAEQHEREYGEKYTHPFITQQLNLLRTQKTTLETE